MHPKVESGKSRSVNLNLCARMPLPTKCVADVSQAVSTGRLDRAVPAHALAGHRISWQADVIAFCPRGGVSSYWLRGHQPDPCLCWLPRFPRKTAAMVQNQDFQEGWKGRARHQGAPAG